MIFLGSAIAWVMVVVGFLRTALGGFFVAFNFRGEALVSFSKRYLGSATTGEAINQGMIMLAAGVIIGLIAIIAKNTSSN